MPNLNDDVWRYLRGSSFEESPYKARSAFRDEGPVNMRMPRWGFRVVRTLPSDVAKDATNFGFEKHVFR